MYLKMDAALAELYTSPSQKARVMTEMWVENNLYCPRCGSRRIAHFENNKPVADFYCPLCQNQYELKSKNGSITEKISDGAYSTMLERITCRENPDFLFMSYSKADWSVEDIYFVPKHFFTPEIIEKRKPLSPTAVRAGWTGCNILLGRIPLAGRIPIVTDGIEQDKEAILRQVSLANALDVKDIRARGWLLDVLTCVDRIGEDTFPLAEVYRFEKELSAKHPDNNNVRAKVRQQLQQLRDRGVLEFVRLGVYRKVRP